eukprot:6209762-Pleurochrysis_carterae.AAC.1
MHARKNARSPARMREVLNLLQPLRLCQLEHRLAMAEHHAIAQPVVTEISMRARLLHARACAHHTPKRAGAHVRVHSIAYKHVHAHSRTSTMARTWCCMAGRTAGGRRRIK